MLMIASVSFLDVAFILVVAVGGVIYMFRRGQEAEKKLAEWAAREGFEILHFDRGAGAGPFSPIHVLDRVIYRVKVRDREGAIRMGWLRLVGMGGAWSDKSEVRWD